MRRIMRGSDIDLEHSLERISSSGREEEGGEEEDRREQEEGKQDTAEQGRHSVVPRGRRHHDRRRWFPSTWWPCVTCHGRGTWRRLLLFWKKK